MINQEFMNNLSPVEISFVHAAIYKLCKDKILPETTNYDNFIEKVEECPHCHAKHIVKNGFNPHNKQKYRCKECRAVFTATTKTMFTHSKTSFETWSVLIAGELNGLTLQQESVETGLSVTTCFHMRHKLYCAASKIQKSVKLSGLIEMDPAYTKINLKGTLPEKMPRFSKKRGKTNSSMYSREHSGISGHKICLLTAIDENDNILFKIAGLGVESLSKLNKFKTHFKSKSTIISDDKPCIKNFAEENDMISEVIPSLANQKRYLTEKGNSIASVNELHTEAKNQIRQKHGIGTRHLQGYLDWLVFKKKMKYTLEMRKWKSAAYMETMHEIIPFVNAEICSKPMPVDLYEAYGSYAYGIYALIN